MAIAEIMLAAIADAVFSYIVAKGGDELGGWAKNKLGLDPAKKAFKEALGEAFEDLERDQPYWVAEQFDASFLKHEGAPILAAFLVRDGRPDASELAARWTDSLNIKQPERRAFHTRELEPVAASFLESLAHRLKAKEELSELHDSRAFEQLAGDVRAIRGSLGAEKATTGTWRDYLRWLIERNLYLDPRGTYPMQRRVQVKLDEVYVSLQAERDEVPEVADQQALVKKTVGIEKQAAASRWLTEELEDRRELLLAHSAESLDAERPGEALELAEVVTRHDRVVILGDPGSGKTTLLRYLALKHAEALWSGRAHAGTDLGKARFPILVRIAEYAESGAWKTKSLGDFLTESYLLHDCPRHGLADLLQGELEKGNCLVLLDGLDEIVSADERLGVVKHIEDFVRRYADKANRFVVTGRRAGYRSAPLTEAFTHYMIRDMDEAQIRRFLERWCPVVEDAQTPELSVQERRRVAKREIEGIMKAVKDSPGVRRLAANPLLLRTLALIHRTGAQLPQKRIEIYKLAADVLGRTWRTAQGVPESALVKDEYLTPLLSKLAYWMHLDKPTGIATEHEVYCVLGEEWARLYELRWDEDEPNPKIREEIRKFLLAVREHTGLFVEHAPSRFGFMHLIFEEYYAARYLVARGKTRAKLIRQHLHQSRWEEPILLALGFVGLESAEGASALVETAILAGGEEAKVSGFTPSPYEDLLGRDYLFALRCLGDNVPVRPELLKRQVERLAGELLYNEGSARYYRYRQALTERLKYLGRSEGAAALVPRLIAALGDSTVKDTVRDRAAESLCQLGQGNPEAIAALLHILGDSKMEVTVPFQATESLRQAGQGSPEVITELLRILWDSKVKDDVRKWAAHSLGEVGQGNPKVIAELLKVLEDSTVGVDIRESVVFSLGRLGEGSLEAIMGLLKVLEDSTMPDIRSWVADRLGEMRQGSPEVTARLLKVLEDSMLDVYIRYHVAESLVKLEQGSPEVIVGLLQDSRVQADVREHATWGLRKLGQGNPEMIARLLKVLEDSTLEASVRKGVAEGLGEVGQGNPGVIAGLLKVLGDSTVEATVREGAARSLINLGQGRPEVIAGLLKVLGDSTVEAYIREGAGWGLIKVGQGSPEVTAGLLKVLEDSREEDDIRSWVASALGVVGQGSPEVTPRLLKVLEDNMTKVEHNMMKVYVCENAIRSLGQLGRESPEAIVGLLRVLGNNKVKVNGSKEGYVQTRIVESLFVESLGRVGQGNQEVIAGLLKVLENSTLEVFIRRDAAWGLGKVGQGNPEVIERLLRVLEDSTVEAIVRASAAGSLGRLGRESPEVIERLLKVLEDSTLEDAVREGAGWGLGEVRQGNPKAIAGLLKMLEDSTVGVDIRYRAARSLIGLGQVSPKATAVLVETLRRAEYSSVRRDAAHLLGLIGQANKATLDGLRHGLLDAESEVRIACAQALAWLGKRFPAAAQGIAERFIRAMKSPHFAKPDKDRFIGRPGYDYAYDGLWWLVAGEEEEDNEEDPWILGI